jgi:hypothetical protein
MKTEKTFLDSKIRAHEVIVECRPNWVMPLTGALPDIETCQKFTGETKAKQGGGHYEKQIVLPKMELTRQTRRGTLL